MIIRINKLLTYILSALLLLISAWTIVGYAIEYMREPQPEFIKFNDTLRISPFADGENWYLLDDYTIMINKNSEYPEEYQKLTVPKGFVTDFASVPWLATLILPKWDLYGQAAIVHDFLYWAHICERDEADQILDFAMKDSSVHLPKRKAIYLAVSFFGDFSLFGLFGDSPWEGNIKKRNAGINRVINLDDNKPKPLESYKDYAERYKNPKKVEHTEYENKLASSCKVLKEWSKPKPKVIEQYDPGLNKS
jgi:Protein of unknown function (DUF1353)